MGSRAFGIGTVEKDPNGSLSRLTWEIPCTGGAALRQPIDTATSRRRRRHAPPHRSALGTLARRGMSARLRADPAGEDPGPPLRRTFAARNHLGAGPTDHDPTPASGVRIAALIQSHPARPGAHSHRRRRSLDPGKKVHAQVIASKAKDGPRRRAACHGARMHLVLSSAIEGNYRECHRRPAKPQRRSDPRRPKAVAATSLQGARSDEHPDSVHAGCWCARRP
jgi:hypothetical protein